MGFSERWESCLGEMLQHVVEVGDQQRNVHRTRLVNVTGGSADARGDILQELEHPVLADSQESNLEIGTTNPGRPPGALATVQYGTPEQIGIELQRNLKVGAC